MDPLDPQLTVHRTRCCERKRLQKLQLSVCQTVRGPDIRCTLSVRCTCTRCLELYFLLLWTTTTDT